MMENIPVVDYDKTRKDLISDFNEAKFQIFRLHLLWQSCNALSQSGRLKEWKWKLDSVWRELSPDAKEKDKGKDGEKDTYFKKIEAINENIAEAKGNESLYNALQEKEIFLRCLQDDVGKGSKRKSIEEDDIDE